MLNEMMVIHLLPSRRGSHHHGDQLWYFKRPVNLFSQQLRVVLTPRLPVLLGLMKESSHVGLRVGLVMIWIFYFEHSTPAVNKQNKALRVTLRVDKTMLGGNCPPRRNVISSVEMSFQSKQCQF